MVKLLLGNERCTASNTKMFDIAVFVLRKTKEFVSLGILGYQKLSESDIYSQGCQGFLINHKTSVIVPRDIVDLTEREISDKSCVLVLDDYKSCFRFEKAVIVDDVWEVLKIARDFWHCEKGSSRRFEGDNCS